MLDRAHVRTCSLVLTAVLMPALTAAEGGLEQAAAAARGLLDASYSPAAPALSGGPVHAAGFLDRSRIRRRAAYETTTRRTDVCSDGVYTRSDILRWRRYQRSRGYNDRFRDDTRQDETAAGRVDPFRTAYVVVPRSRRDLLHTDVRVCVLATGRCAWARALEIGPRFGELSIKAMMDLGLDSHPQYGRYSGRVRYTFYRR